MAGHAHSKAAYETQAKFCEAQLKFNEEFRRFQAEVRSELEINAHHQSQINEGIAELKSKMGLVRSQLGEVLNLLQLRSEGTETPIGQINSNRDEPTNGSVVDQLHALDDALEDVSEFNEALPLLLVEKIDGDDRNAGNVDNGGGVLPFIDLESIVSSEGEGIAIKHELKSFPIHESVEEDLKVGKLLVGELGRQSSLMPDGRGAAHNLFDEIPISALDIKTSCLVSAQTMELIKCKCTNPTLLIDNDVVFYFDPGGYTVSQRDCESFKLLGEQGGLSLGFVLAADVSDALAKAFNHEPWIREAYAYGDVIEYSGTKMEFVGERLARNALMAWSLIDRDCEGQKIDHVILRNVLDSFVVISSKNVCVCVVDRCSYAACVLAMQFMLDMLLVSSPLQIFVSSAGCQLTNSAINEKLRKLVLQGSGHFILLEHVKRIHGALEFDDVTLVWMMLCNVLRVEEIRGLFCDTMVFDGKYDANQEPRGIEYLFYNVLLTDIICYLFDPGGSYFLFIIWNHENFPFPHGSGNATTLCLLIHVSNSVESVDRFVLILIECTEIINQENGKPSDNWVKHIGFWDSSSSFDDGIVAIEWTVLIWGPGLCAIFIYILEDKDVFKRVGKWMISMDTIWDVVGYGHVLVLNEMLNIWITKIRPSILGIAYRDDEDSESDSTSNFLLLKLERHQWGNLYVSYVIFRRMGRAFFSRFRRTLSQLVGKRLSSNTISIRFLYFLPKATIPNMSYGPYEPSSAGIWLEYQPLFHFRLPLAPPIAVVDVKSSSCSRLGRLENEDKANEDSGLENEELWSSTLITHLAIKIDEGFNKIFEIKVGYGLAIEIKYFWCCVSNASQIFLIDDDRFKKGHKLVALIEATILEHFVWDPGLIWGFSSHHPEIQTFHKQHGLIFFLHQQAISRVCTTLRTRLFLRGGVCHELSR